MCGGFEARTAVAWGAALVAARRTRSGIKALEDGKTSSVIRVYHHRLQAAPGLIRVAGVETRARVVTRTPARPSAKRWWVLLIQLPTTPAYIRVKVSRRLQKLGAVAIKNSVYALPHTDQAREDFEWLLREVRADGGDGSLLEAQLVEGLTDAQVERLFVEARTADYRELAKELERVEAEAPRSAMSDAQRRELESRLARLRKHAEEIQAIEFVPTGKRKAIEERMRKIEQRVSERPQKTERKSAESYRGRTWVTRKGIKVDRIASAWLIRRFIDPEAKFRFVSPEGFKPKKDDLRFDMFEAEFTHEGDGCTFETLIARMKLKDRALRPLAEIIHDIDIKDGKFGRPEASGVALMIEAITSSSKSDLERLERGSKLFDDLHAALGRTRA